MEHFWACYRDCQVCSYPERTGDLRSVVKASDFYSVRQWHSTGMYSDFLRPRGCEHHLELCLPDPAGLSTVPERLENTGILHLHRLSPVSNPRGEDFIPDRERGPRGHLGGGWALSSRKSATVRPR